MNTHNSQSAVERERLSKTKESTSFMCWSLSVLLLTEAQSRIKSTSHHSCLSFYQLDTELKLAGLLVEAIPILLVSPNIVCFLFFLTMGTEIRGELIKRSCCLFVSLRSLCSQGFSKKKQAATWLKTKIVGLTGVNKKSPQLLQRMNRNAGKYRKETRQSAFTVSDN